MPDDQAVREWFSATWCSGEKCIPEGDGHLEFRVEFHAEASASEVAEVWAEVGDRMDHPRRAWAERQRERLRHGPSVTESDFWRSATKWRYNETYFEPDGEVFGYVDRAWTPSLTWSIDPKVLHLADPDAPPAPNAEWYRRPEIGTELLATACRGFFHGKIGTQNASSGPEIESVEFADDHWVVRIARPRGYQWAYEIAYDENAGVYRVLSMLSRQRQEDGTWRETGRTDFSEEMLETPWGPAHREVEWRTADGRLTRRYVLLEATDILPSDVESYFQLPPADGEDPLRGAVTVASIYDYRPGVGRLTQVTASAGRTTRPLQGAPTRGPSIRLLGWILAGVLAATIVFIRIRRRREARSNLT